MSSRLFLISNSKVENAPRLAHVAKEMEALKSDTCFRVLFIPFAAVGHSFDEYVNLVKPQFLSWGFKFESIHNASNHKEAIGRAHIIAVAGGNSFVLLNRLQEAHLLEPIREQVGEGAVYIGWSAGANLACPTIKTSNDMAIVETRGLAALHLVPFQINPHYTDRKIEGFQGETRDQRIAEFLELHAGVYVVGLREGTWLEIEEGKIQLKGVGPAKIFKNGQEPLEMGPADDLRFLLN